MNVNHNCNGIPPDGNFKHLDHTYVMPKQYELFDFSEKCKGIPPQGNFRHLDHTYVMPKQYEAYSNCNGIPPERNFKKLDHTYLLPKPGELFQLDTRIGCMGIPGQDGYQNIDHTYVMPKQYEAFDISDLGVTQKGILKNFLSPEVVESQKGVQQQKAFLSASSQEKSSTLEELSNAATQSINSSLGLNLQDTSSTTKPVKPVYTSVSSTMNDKKEENQLENTQFLNPIVRIVNSVKN
jgi:hypothetical protein